MVALLLASAASSGCSGVEDADGARQDAWPQSTWSTAAPEALGLDPLRLEEARQYAFAPERNTQAIVVVRGGNIVAEWYAPGTDARSWATSWSVGKSIASALVGMAIDEGLIESVDVPMSRFIPSWVGTAKEKILLRHVLQMTTGQEWSEAYELTSIFTSDVVQLVIRGHELDYAASRPLISAPGTVFDYSSGTAMLLSAVIQQATGMSAEQYARKKLFAPLGIGQVDWWQSAEGHTLTFCCVDMTSRDFARFGLLYARGGTWAGQQLISPRWIHESTTPSPVRPGYGYMWWLLGVQDQEGPPIDTPPTPSTLPPDTFAAIGVDDQIIYIVPQLDLVVVRNGIYFKDTGPAVATPDLLLHMPPSGLIPFKGTLAPSDWNHANFLNLVIAAIRH